MKDLPIYVLAAVIAIVGVVNVKKDPVEVRVASDGVEVVELGAASGPEHTEMQVFKAGAVYGGAVVSTSTADSSATLLAADLINVRSGVLTTRLEVTPTGGNLTLTLPASSTLASYLPKNGDTHTFVVENEASAATTTTIAAGAGMDLQEPDGQNVVIGQNNYALITVQRDEDTNFVVWVDETIPAD